MRIARTLLLSAGLFAAPLVPPALAETAVFEGAMAGAAVVPPVETAATGFFRAEYDTDNRETIWLVTYQGLSGPATAIRIHGPAAAGENGEIVLSFLGSLASPIIGGSTLSPEAGEAFLAGELYLVICTAAFPDGELRVQIMAPALEPEVGGEE